MVVGGIVVAGWRFISDKRPTGVGIPVIKADERPIKTRPDDRGGMQVPNQDKLVYERMDGEGEAKTERLLPPPEQPHMPPKGAVAVTPPALAPVPAAPLPVTPVTPLVQPPQIKPAAPSSSDYSAVQNRQAPTPAPAPAPVPVAAKPVKTPPPAPVSVPAPAPQVAAAPPTPHKVPASGEYLVQLGAVRSADAADKEWTRIQHANSEILASLHSDIVRVELGEKGTYWRVRAGPLSEQAGRSICQELGHRNQGCILVHK